MARTSITYNRAMECAARKKERSPDACQNTDEPWKHQAKWKKSDTEGHVLYHSVEWNGNVSEEDNP